MKDFDYHTLIHMLDEMSNEDRKVLLKIDIASAVLRNLILKGYDDEEIDEVCTRIEKFLLSVCDWPNLDDFVSRIQFLIETGEYGEIPTEESIVDAYQLAQEQCL